MGSRHLSIYVNLHTLDVFIHLYKLFSLFNHSWLVCILFLLLRFAFLLFSSLFVHPFFRFRPNRLHCVVTWTWNGARACACVQEQHSTRRAHWIGFLRNNERRKINGQWTRLSTTRTHKQIHDIRWRRICVADIQWSGITAENIKCKPCIVM